MSRGRFNRNEVEVTPGHWIMIEQETKIKKGGNVFLAHNWYNNNYAIFWRRTKNIIRYWSDGLDCIKLRIGTLDEAERYYKHALETYNPGPNATRRCKRRGKPDSQRKRVYAWERGLFNAPSTLDKHPLNEKLTPVEVKDLFKKVLDHYDIPKNERPVLKLRSCYGKSSFNHGWGSQSPFIRLSKSHNKTWVIIHELSHFLTYRASSEDHNNIAGHGPEFVGYYIDALVEVGGQDLKVLLKSCRDFQYKTRKRTMRGIKYVLPTTNELNSLKEVA